MPRAGDHSVQPLTNYFGHLLHNYDSVRDDADDILFGVSISYWCNTSVCKCVLVLSIICIITVTCDALCIGANNCMRVISHPVQRDFVHNEVKHWFYDCQSVAVALY